MQLIRPGEAVLAVVNSRASVGKVEVNLKCLNQILCLGPITLKNALTHIDYEGVDVEHAEGEIEHFEAEQHPQRKVGAERGAHWETIGEQLGSRSG